MKTVTLIGIDLGKHSFHLHGQDRCGRKPLRQIQYQLVQMSPAQSLVRGFSIRCAVHNSADKSRSVPRKPADNRGTGHGIIGAIP